MGLKERFTLLDVTITVQTEDGQNVTIGACEEVSIEIKRDLLEAYEAGTHEAAEIIETKQHVSGRMTRAYIDTETLQTLFPNQVKLPYFSLTGKVSNRTPERTFTILNAKAGGFNISNLTTDGYAKNEIEFTARSYKLD